MKSKYYSLSEALMDTITTPTCEVFVGAEGLRQVEMLTTSFAQGGLLYLFGEIPVIVDGDLPPSIIQVKSRFGDCVEFDVRHFERLE